MIAVDTNVVVRLVTNDDPVQSPRAAQLFVEEDVFVSRTVLLEVEWVLRGAYGLAPSVIHAAFVRLAATPCVTVEDADAVARALIWFGTGMDFADALHLASADRRCVAFRTFDRRLARRAGKAAAEPPVGLV